MSLVKTPDTVSGDYTLLGKGGLRRGFTETFLNQVPDGTLRGSNYSVSSRQGSVSTEAERLIRREYKLSGLAVNFGDQSSEYVSGYSSWSPELKGRLKPVLRDFSAGTRGLDRGLEKTHLKIAATKDVAFVATADFNSLLVGEKPESRAFNEALIIKDPSTVKDINSVLDLILSDRFSTNTNVAAELKGKLTSANVFVTGPGFESSDDRLLQQTLYSLGEGDQAVVSFPYASQSKLSRSLISASKAGADVVFVGQNPYGKKGGGSQDGTSRVIREMLSGGVSVRLQPLGSALEANMHKKQIATSKNLYVGSTNMSLTSSAHTLELGALARSAVLGKAAMSDSLAEADAYGFIDVMSNPEKFLDILGGMQGYRKIKAQAALGDFSDIIRPSFKLSSDPKTEITGEAAYLPTQLQTSFFQNYGSQNPKIYQNYFQTVNGFEPTGFRGHVLKIIDAQLADPGLGLSLNRLTGLDLYQQDRGILGSSLALFGRALDNLSGFHYMRQLEEIQDGSTRGSIRRLHRESYGQSSYAGPFENTANFLTETIASTASSVALYFGVTHAASLYLSHLEQVSTDNIVSNLYSKDAKPLASRVSRGLLSVLPKEVEEVIIEAGERSRLGEIDVGTGQRKGVATVYESLGQGVNSVLDNLIDRQIQSMPIRGYDRINSMLASELSAIESEELSGKQFTDSEKKKRLEQVIGVVNEQVGTAQNPITHRIWRMDRFTQSGVGTNMADSVGILRRAESALVQDVVIPLLGRFMVGDPEEKAKILGELSDLSKAPLGLNLTSSNVEGVGVARKSAAAAIWDKVAGSVPANFMAADQSFAQGIGTSDDTVIKTRGPNDTIRPMKGSSIAINAFIGSGFVDIIRTTTKIGGIVSSAVSTRNFSLKQTMSGVYDDFYDTRKGASPVAPGDLHLALDGKGSSPVGSIARVRKAFFIAGSALIADRIIDAYYLKPQGVDLLTQLAAEVRGDMGRDEERFARNEFTGTMPEVVKTGSLFAGAALGGFLFATNADIDGRVVKRFNYKFAALGAVGALFAAQAGTSIAATYLNFIYQRGKNNGLHVSPEGSALAGLFSSTVKKERESPYTTPERLAAQTVLMRAAKEYTRPDVKSVRSTYNVAIQLPNPIFQLTFVSRRDPASGTTSYSGGFQLLPILGSGAIPTSPFGIKTGANVTSSIQRRMLAFLSDMPKPVVEDAATSSDPGVKATYNNEMALLASSSFTDLTNILQFIPESQMFGALGTIGAISYARTMATAFAPVSGQRPSTSFDVLKDVVGFGVGQTERMIRLAQVPTLLLPNISKTFLQNLTASKQVRTGSRFGKASRVLGPYGLALAAGFSLTSLDSAFGGAASLSMLRAEHDLKQNPTYDASGVINAATAQSLYTASAVGLYYGAALQRSGAFASTKAFSETYESLKGLSPEEISKFTGDKYYQYTMGEIYAKSAGDPKLIDSMGVRTGMAARRLFKYGAFAFGLAYLASATGALSHDTPLSGLLDPLRLTGFDNLTEQQKLLLKGGQKQAGERADGSLMGGLSAGSSFFLGNFFGLFNAGKLTGSYQDNPGMFVNVAGAFGFSESTYGPKPYIQSTTAFMDISNSQIDMRILFGQSQESVKLLKNVLRAPKGSNSSQLYYALIGSTPRKTPVRLKGGYTSSELRAASTSSGLARALAIRQAEQMRLANQRPEELDYSLLYDKVQRVATAKQKGSGKVFMPGGRSQFSVFTSNIGFRDRTAIENVLKALDPNSSLDSSFYDSYERDVVTQQAAGIPFVSTYIKTLTQAGSIYEKGSSPLGMIDLALGVALTAGIAVSTYSLATSLFGAFALSSIESRKSRYVRDVNNLTEGYLYKYRLAVANNGYGLQRGATLTSYSTRTLSNNNSNALMAGDDPDQSPKPLRDLQDVYGRNREKLTNYTAMINAATTSDEAATVIKNHYLDDVFETRLYGENVSKDDFARSLQGELDTTLSRGGIFAGIDESSATARLEKQRSFLRYIDSLDDSVTASYFTGDPPKAAPRSFARTLTRLSPTASPEVKNLRQTIDQIGYVGTLKEALGGMGQAIFTLSAGSDLYSLASALTEAGSSNTRDREIASYYAANMFVETSAAFATFPLLRLVTANLAASAVVLAGTIIGLNVDKMTGGNAMKALSEQIHKLNKDVYEPALRSTGRLISNITSQGPISGALSVLGAPFRLLDPLLTDLYIKSQQSAATAFIGQVLLPRPLEAYLLTQRGLLPSDRSILGRRFEEYTQAETDANRTQRYIQNLRRASSLGSSISDELLHPNTSGGGYTEYNSRMGIGSRYQTGGYATRIASESERPSRVSSLLRLGLRQKQANVNFTISAAYRGPDNVVQDMLSMFFPLQYLKAGYYQHGSSFRGFAVANAEAVGLLISKLSGVVSFFDPTFDGSGANRFLSWVGRGFKPVAKGVASFIASRAASLGQVGISSFGLDAKLSKFGPTIKNAGVSIRNWGRLHIPGAGIASLTALLLQPMAQRTALLFGADEKTSGLIGGTAAIAGGFGAVALTPKFVSMAWADDSKMSSNKKTLGLLYRFAKQGTKASIFSVSGFVLGSLTALTIQAGLSMVDKPLDEEGYQNLLNVTTGVSTAASLGYYGVLTARNQRPDVKRNPVLGSPFRHLRKLAGSVSSYFSKLSALQKRNVIVGGVLTLGAAVTTTVAKWWEGLSSKRKGELQQSTFEGLAKTAVTSGIIAGTVLAGVAVHDFSVGKHNAKLKNNVLSLPAYFLLERAKQTPVYSLLQSLKATAVATKSSISIMRSFTPNYMPGIRSAMAAAFRPLVGVGLSMSPILFERRILDLNETSTRIKRKDSYKQFFSAAATTALLALTRGKMSHQIMSLGSFDSILQDNDTFDKMVDDYSKDATPEQAASLYTGTIVGLTGLFAATTLAAKKVSPRLLGKVGAGVMPALTAVELMQTSKEKHRGLDAVETRSSVMNRIADQISEDASRASLAGGLSAVRGFNPGGLAVAATGITASILFQTPGFKDYIKKEYAGKFADSGITSKQDVAKVLKKAADTSDRGAATGAVLSTVGVAATAASMFLASAASLAVGAGAVVTAPAWVPFALTGLAIISASALLGGAVGYKHGLDSELEATAQRTYGDGPRRPPRRRRKAEYLNKVRPRRQQVSLGSTPTSFVLPTSSPAKSEFEVNLESKEVSLAKPSFIDSLFGINPAAASEQELIIAAKARRDALLTTFVIDKDPETGKLPQWESREPKKVQPKSWWERLFEWTGQKLRQLGRGVKGAARSAANAVEDFADGVTNFFMGSYDESMIALAAISSLESGHAQGRANVAQSILNRQYAAVNHGLRYGQKSNDIASLIVAEGQYQPVRDGGPRGKAAWAKAAKTGSVEDYITAISLAPSVGGNRQRAREMLFSALRQISDPRLQREAQRQVGARIDFESVASHAANKRGGISKVTDAYGHVFGFMMGSGGINYGRTARTVAPFPVREGGLFGQGGGGAGILFVRNSNDGGPHIHIDLRPNARGRGGAVVKGQETAAETAAVKQAAFLYIKAAFQQGETQLGIHAPQTQSSILTNRSTDAQIMAAINRAGLRGHHNARAAIDINLFNLRRFVGPSLGRILPGSGDGRGVGWDGTHKTSSGVTVHHGLRPVNAPSSAAAASQLPSPSVQTPSRVGGPNARRANQKDWSAQTSKRPGRIVITAGHADDHSGAPGERAFNMRLLDRLEQRLDAAGLGGRVSIYRPGAILPANDPRSQWSIALRTAQQGNYYLELHGDRGDSQGRTGIIVPSPKDKRFRTNAHAYNPLDEDLAAAYGSFSKNHRVAEDNKAIGVAARGGRILEVTTITPEVNRIMQSGDQKKINALLDSYLNNLLPILQKNFGRGRTSPASRRSVRAPQASLAPSTSQSMVDSSVEVVAAIPIEEQAALLAGTLSIMQQAAEQTSKIEKEILSAPIVINPDVHGKTRDNADSTSDPLAPKVREARVPEVVALEKVGGKRVVEVQTAVPVSSHLAKVSNGNIPFGDQLQTSHEPMLLGDYDGNPNTPYGVIQSMHGFA